MLLLLETFIFCLLLTTGASVKCETCKGVGQQCTGETITCPKEQNTCLTELIEFPLEKNQVVTIEKRCDLHSSCKPEFTYSNFGSGKVSRGSVYCCADDSCKTHTTPPQWPPPPQPDAKANGNRCQACYSISASCPKDSVVNCTGTENQCIHLIMKSGETTAEITMKGCATEGYCAQQTRKTSTKGSEVLKALCTPAGKAPPSSGSLLLALSGLFLVKIVS